MIALPYPQITPVGWVEPRPEDFCGRLWWNTKGIWSSREEWELTHTFEVHLPDERLIRIMSGFRMDGASIPRPAWLFVGHPFQRLMLPGATVHDALVRSGLVTRAEADHIFLALMLRYGVHPVKARICFGFVYLAGLVTPMPSKSKQDAVRKFVHLHSKTV